jgi:hypothetical protein
MSALIGKYSALGIDIDPASSTNRFRTARFKQFWTTVETVLREKGRCSILDIGGTVEYWKAQSAALPASVTVTIANISQQDEACGTTGFKSIVADACSMPEVGDNEFDIAHSNSVIEHVGLWQQMAKMAKEVRRVAVRHYVQTPNYWFPFEAHARFPLFQYLPEPWRIALLLKRSRGFWPQGMDIGDATMRCQSAILITHSQMQFLFPNSKIFHEKAFGLTKSLIAVGNCK